MLSLSPARIIYLFSYKLGEWRIGCSKQHPYESDVHIPFFARGPGISPGTMLSALGSNIDIAPTFIDIAGLPPNPEHDGKSLLPMLLSKDGSDERQAIEADWRTSQVGCTSFVRMRVRDISDPANMDMLGHWFGCTIEPVHAWRALVSEALL